MEGLTHRALLEHFPHRTPRANQEQALQVIAKAKDVGVVLEMPTGDGKTSIGIAALRAAAARGKGPLVYITPTKTQVEQVKKAFKGPVLPVLGRADYPCDYYVDRNIPGISAQASPCYMLSCEHRVNQETGETEVPGAKPCEYFQAKYEARVGTKRGGIVVCTTAWFLQNRLMVKEWRDMEPELVIVDEAHRLAQIARGLLEYTITDRHLSRAVKLVRGLDKKQAMIILKFAQTFRRIARSRSAGSRSLLKDQEIERLVAILDEFEADKLLSKIVAAVGSGKIDPLAQQGELKTLENLVRNIPRLIRSLRYSMEGEGRRPLNYVVAFYYGRDESEPAGPEQRARYYLTIKAYFVAPLIRRALGRKMVAYSATIGDPEIFRFETGVDLPFTSFASDFPVDRARIFIPTDASNLAQRARNRQTLNRTLRLIAVTAKGFAKRGHRSLVVVVSEAERKKFAAFATEAGLDVVSYEANGMTAREAAAAFRGGKGEVLVGTVAQYAEGIDLPRQTAPVIFFLRPGYQRPDDPATQFEERRFSKGRCWALWNYRVMIEALQVRGRNIRTATDLGVCFFMSEQFRRFLFNALPEWLRPAYRRELTMEAAVKETMELLKAP